MEELSNHRAELDALVSLLQEKETVDGKDVYRLAGRPDKSAGLAAPPMVVAPHPAEAQAAGSGIASVDGSTSDS